MTIIFKRGDMFTDPAEALVNTVNCVGVMGKGVALEFKKRWPSNFRNYRKLCDEKSLRPGTLFIHMLKDDFLEDRPRYIVNFPTKLHWRSPSKIEYVSDGLDELRIWLEASKVSSIAMPPLGCGNGGLDWRDVRPLIEEKLEGISATKIFVYEPQVSSSRPEYTPAAVQLNRETAILIRTIGMLEPMFSGGFDRLSLQKVVYFLQVFGIDLEIDFNRAIHGPYSEKLRKNLIEMEKSGLIEGVTSENHLAYVSATAFAEANEYLGRNLDEEAEKIVDRMSQLFQGYESPYGLELLSRVHQMVYSSAQNALELWLNDPRKGNEQYSSSFGTKEIHLAYDRLVDDGLVNDLQLGAQPAHTYGRRARN